MAISLNNLNGSKGRAKRKKRIGRGLGSTGTTAGRGQKGQKARSGSSGHQRRGLRRLIFSTPKLRGFTSPHGDLAPVNVGQLADHYTKGELVTPKTLKQKGLISSVKPGVKILGNGEISLALTVKGCAVSKSAAGKITSSGGSIEA